MVVLLVAPLLSVKIAVAVKLPGLLYVWDAGILTVFVPIPPP